MTPIIPPFEVCPIEELTWEGFQGWAASPTIEEWMAFTSKASFIVMNGRKGIALDVKPIQWGDRFNRVFLVAMTASVDLVRGGMSIMPETWTEFVSDETTFERMVDHSAHDFPGQYTWEFDPEYRNVWRSKLVKAPLTYEYVMVLKEGKWKLRCGQHDGVMAVFANIGPEDGYPSMAEAQLGAVADWKTRAKTSVTDSTLNLHWDVFASDQYIANRGSGLAYKITRMNRKYFLHCRTSPTKVFTKIGAVDGFETYDEAKAWADQDLKTR